MTPSICLLLVTKESVMSYKVILVYIDLSEHMAERVRVAAEIAARHEAHLVGVAMTGISRYFSQQRAGNKINTFTASVGALQKQAEEALCKFDKIIAGTKVQSYERALMEDEPYSGLCLGARYADLVVVSQNDIDDPSTSGLPDLPEYVVLNSGRPTLVVPRSGTFRTIGERVLIGWDDSMNASRAVTAAIPILRMAKNVELVLFNASGNYERSRADQGLEIALFLARHGIHVEVMRQSTTYRIGNALVSLGLSGSADLLVMGAYGHTRFTEILLDGVTETVIAKTAIPALMCH